MDSCEKIFGGNKTTFALGKRRPIMMPATTLYQVKIENNENVH